jgi:hypothetical protein
LACCATQLDCLLLNPFVCSAVIGEVDDEKDAALDFSQIRAPPLKPLTH